MANTVRTPIFPKIDFKISGTIIHGDQVGRTIGFPTTNLDVSIREKDLEPGVYFAQCQFASSESLPIVLQKTFYGLPYFGPRYIFGEVKNSFEVYLYDFSQDVYGLTLKVMITHKIRKPLKFDSLEVLKEQLELDKIAGESLLP